MKNFHYCPGAEDELKTNYIAPQYGNEAAKLISTQGINDPGDSGISRHEAKWETKDGGSKMFLGTSFMVDKDAFASITSDVSEIKRTELEKTDALNTMKEILDGLDAIIYVTDPVTGEMLFMNNSMRRHYGFDGDVEGRICYKVLQEGMDERCDFCPCHKLDKEPDSVIVWEMTDHFTQRIHRKTDRYIKWPGGKTAHLQHAVDITDLVQANELNRKMTAELKTALLETQDANRARDEFLARMSHEMLTPMNAIMGMTQVIQMQDLPDDLKEDFDKIENASNDLLKLINALLDITEKKNESFMLVESAFLFGKMFRGVMKEIYPNIVKKQQTLSFDIDRSIPAPLIGDKKRLSQVIYHLITNAIKFTPENGEINFSACVLDDNDGVITLQVEVSDTGVGMTKEQQIKIFNLFEQADDGLTRKHGGIGLGLSLSEHIVDLMGGKIWVKSEPSKGSTFTFTCKLKKG